MTNSLAFPNMFDGARCRVGVLEGDQSIVNRTRLLILTDPESLYNEPDFGVGVKKYMWQYNSENTWARLRDNIIEQLKMYEPCVDAEDTQFSKSLITENVSENSRNFNRMTMTVGLRTVFGNNVEVKFDDLQEIIDSMRAQMGDESNA